MFDEIWRSGAAEGMVTESVDMADSWEEKGVTKSASGFVALEKTSMASYASTAGIGCSLNPPILCMPQNGSSSEGRDEMLMVVIGVVENGAVYADIVLWVL